MTGYVCKSCGQHHEGMPLSCFVEFPSQWESIPEGEREERCVLGEEQCIIDDTLFFMRGNIEIPVVDMDEVFAWTVWVSVSKQDFERASDMWDDPRRKSEPRYPCQLANNLPFYPDTLNLRGFVHTREVGFRPAIELEESNHPLVVEQRQGITRARVQEIAEALLHGSS